MGTDDRTFGDASRRTYLANERTYLAWLRSALAALGVSIAVGRLLPALLDVSPTPFVVLGIGFGLLGLFLFVLGAIRQRGVERALATGVFPPLSGVVVVGLAIYGAALSLATLVLVATEL